MSQKRNRFFKDPALPHVECRYTYDSDAHYTPHRHATLSIGAITERIVSFDNRTQTDLLTPSALIIINPETLHACNPIEGEARSYRMLYLDATWCTQLYNSLFWGGIRITPGWRTPSASYVSTPRIDSTTSPRVTESTEAVFTSSPNG